MHQAFGERSRAARIWTAINKYPALTFGGIAALYALVACAQAATRLLWCDELITLAVARTGSLAAIWRALQLGADPNPPLIHLAVLVSTRVFGQSALAVRLPAIAAMGATIGCVWLLLRRWVAPGFAAVGVLAFMATRGFDYSYEARSYAPLAAFTMAAVMCWMSAADYRRGEGQKAGLSRIPRSAGLVGMSLCLALALSSNYYGFLAWLPVGAGEIVLSVRLRRIRVRWWVAMAAAAAPLYAYLPVIRHNLAEFGPHAGNRVRFSLVSESYLLLVEGVFWPVLLGGLVAGWRRWRQAEPVEAVAENIGVQPHEWAALGCLLLYPVLGFLFAAGPGAMISPRCVLPVCCGFGIAAGLLAAKLGRRPRYAVGLLALSVLWVVGRQIACAVILQHQKDNFLRLVREMQMLPDQPVYTADILLALPLAHYGDPDLRSRLVYPVDFAAIHAWEREDSGEQNLWAGKDGVFPIRIVPYSPGLARMRPGMVTARPGGWLVRDLARDGLELRDVTTPEESVELGKLGGVFTPMAHEQTRLLAPAAK